MQYMLLIFATMLQAADFACNKIYQKREGTSIRAILKFNALLGLFTAALFFVANGFRVNFTMYSFFMAAAMNLLVICYNFFGFQLLKRGSVAVYTLFLMTGGMTLPYIWGVAFLGEPLTAVRTVALVLICVGVIVSNAGGKNMDLKTVIMCGAVFLLNGFVSVVSKKHQIEDGFPCISATDFVLLGGLFKFVLSALLYLCVRKQESEYVRDSNTLAIFIIIASAAVSGASYYFQLLGAASLPASVLYPFVTGGTIIFSALVGRFLFREAVSRKLVLGIVFCFVGTLLFL